MNKRIGLILVSVVILLVAGGAPLHAQIGNPFAKKSDAPAVDIAKALAGGADLIGYIQLANDLGVSAAEQMIAMYPEAKVADVRKLAAQHNELKAKRVSGKIDAEEAKLVEDMSAKLATLQKEDAWKGYQKEKSANVNKAYSKLGLMLVADGLAATRVKPTTDNLQAALKEISKNPTQVAKADALKTQVASLAVVAPLLPKQVESTQTVRSICSKIAAAEKITLAADVSVDKVKDLTSLTAATKELGG